MPSRLNTRLSYCSSEVAGQLIFCVISFYLLKFYTDIYGISAAAAASIMLIARCIDGIDAPVWGVIFERTHSRYGKSRPWFLWLCVPFALFGALTFFTPPLSVHGKIIWAAVTYIGASVLYTGVNTPVTSILAALTPDSHERVVLTTWRMFGSKAGVLFVNLTVLRFAHALGHGNDRLGFMRIIPIYACGTILLYLIAFRNLREVVQPLHPRISARQSFRAIRGNAPWLIIFLSSLLFWIAFTSRITAAPYFFQYVLHRGGLVSVANSLDFISLGSVFCLPWLTAKLTKRNTWALGLAGCVVGQLVLVAAASSRSVPLVFFGWGVGFFASGAAMALPFSILSDSVDYGEWRSGVRAAGLLTAIGAAFCLKAGSGLGGALPGYILAASGYVPNAEQTATAIHGIALSFIWLPAVAYGLAIVPVLFYRRYERMEPSIRADLAARSERDLATAATLESESV